MSSVPDGRAANQPLAAITLMPPIAASLPGALARTRSIGGIKVIAASGWFAARPSGTEDIYKIYAESFTSAAHLQRILEEAQAVVDRAIAALGSASDAPRKP
jgi:phosphoglucomutase